MLPASAPLAAAAMLVLLAALAAVHVREERSTIAQSLRD